MSGRGTSNGAAASLVPSACARSVWRVGCPEERRFLPRAGSCLWACGKGIASPCVTGFLVSAQLSSSPPRRSESWRGGGQPWRRAAQGPGVNVGLGRTGCPSSRLCLAAARCSFHCRSAHCLPLASGALLKSATAEAEGNLLRHCGWLVQSLNVSYVILAGA